ncbi:MAG: YHS domain-containing protein [Chloroflexi bacterium]|nr:YHS domain-containing protein [Chloroflexota bacterium]
MPDDETSHTQVPNPVQTTVCHRVMTTAIEWYPHAEYQGRTIYFCTEFCLEAFHADPERFYIAHSRIKNLRK